MKKRSKTKTKTTKSKRKVNHIESHYLAIALVAFLLIEGFLFTSTQRIDWQNGTAVLDMSSAVAETSHDMQVVFQPVMDTVDGVNAFYSLATTAMMQLLDISDANPGEQISFVTDGVTQFYQEASIQMAQLLDASSGSSWPGSVAGASVSVY